MPTEETLQRKYQEVFEQTCQRVAHRRRTDRDFSVDQLRGLLNSAYVSQGNDWVGRGGLHHVVQSAVIAAYEHMLAEWS